MWCAAAALAVLGAPATWAYTNRDMEEAAMLNWLVARFDASGNGLLSYHELASLGMATDAPLGRQWYQQIATGMGVDPDKGFDFPQMWRVYKELNNDPGASIERDVATVQERLPQRLLSVAELDAAVVQQDLDAGTPAERTIVLSLLPTSEGGPGSTSEQALTTHERLSVVHGNGFRVVYPATEHLAAQFREHLGLSSRTGAAMRRAGGKPRWVELPARFAGDEKQLMQWAWKYGTRLVQVFPEHAVMQYHVIGLPILMIFVPLPDEAEARDNASAPFLTSAYEVAQDFLNLAFTVRNLDAAPEKLLTSLGFSKAGPDDGQMTGILDAPKKKRWRWPTGTPFNAGNLRRFVAGWADGSLPPFELNAPQEGTQKIASSKRTDEL